MKKAVLLLSAAVLLLMGGVALGRWSLVRQGAVIKGGGQTGIALAPLDLRPAAEAGGLVQRKININTAGPEELRELPGVGEAISGRIVEYREEYGSFASIEELKAIQGIGDALFARLEPYITIQ